MRLFIYFLSLHNRDERVRTHDFMTSFVFFAARVMWVLKGYRGSADASAADNTTDLSDRERLVQIRVTR